MYSLLILSALGYVSAYPFAGHEIRATSPGVIVSQAQTNCGPLPCPVFNAKDQYVDTTKQFAFVAPGPTDIRGPCPGLNAAANHQFFSHDGVIGIGETTSGLETAYNFEPAFAAALAVFAIVMDGDVLTQTWSIGGPPPFTGSLNGILYPPQGISYSHNKYEGDVSIGRNDAYLDNGDAHSLNVTRWMNAYTTGLDDDRYTLDKFRQAFLKNVYFSIENNPYYFSPALAGAIVPPAAYNFVINFMSNHSEEVPSGYLDSSTFKSFFSVVGEYPNLQWVPGHEKFPANWYRRPTYNQYGAAKLAEDDAIGWAAYPDGFRLGGNVNGVNTYEGVDIATLTGGQYTNTTALKGFNFACIAFQAQQQALPDFLKGGINDITTSLALVAQYLGPILTELECKPLSMYDATLFNKYPGRTYSPTAPQ